MVPGWSNGDDGRDGLAGEVEALLGPQAQVAGHPLVVAARSVAATWAADAARVDGLGGAPGLRVAGLPVDLPGGAPEEPGGVAGGVDRDRVDLAAQAGLLGVTAPAALGGAGAPRPVARAVTETLAGACGTTWFVTAQHAMPMAMAVQAALGEDPSGSSPAVQRARRLAQGRDLGATAVAHLRRPGPPPVAAGRDGDGWRVSGHVGWLTSWGLADVLLLGARAGDDVVLGLVPARDAPGLVAGAPMRLAAMQGTRTTTLTLEGFLLREEDVLDVVPAGDWLAADAARTADVVPAVYGLLASLCRALVAASGRPGAGPAADVARAAAERGAALREQAYQLVDDVPAGEEVAERLRLRAASLELLVTTSGALVAAGAGAAMSLGHPAQRWAREALFHLVQAQTAAVREATLTVWDERVSAPARAPSPTR